jgi:DNA-binding winged helix-turn-helix (wHTH) protein
VLSRSQLFEAVWGYDFGPRSNSLEVYVGYLRRKTEEGGEPRLIQTVRGVGYSLRETGRSSASPAERPRIRGEARSGYLGGRLSPRSGGEAV